MLVWDLALKFDNSSYLSAVRMLQISKQMRTTQQDRITTAAEQPSPSTLLSSPALATLSKDLLRFFSESLVRSTLEEWRTRERAGGRGGGARMCCNQGGRENKGREKMQRREHAHTISTSPGPSNFLPVSQELLPSMESWFGGPHHQVCRALGLRSWVLVWICGLLAEKTTIRKRKRREGKKNGKEQHKVKEPT